MYIITLVIFCSKASIVKTKGATHLPVWVVLAVAARHGANVGFLGGQVRRYPVLEVVPGKMILSLPLQKGRYTL